MPTCRLTTKKTPFFPRHNPEDITKKANKIMRKTNTEQLGTIIRQFLREEGLETPLNQHRIISAWTEVMGMGIAKYTGNIYIKNQTLFVQIKSPALKADLMMMRNTLVQKLNNHVHAQVITSINFY